MYIRCDNLSFFFSVPKPVFQSKKSGQYLRSQSYNQPPEEVLSPQHEELIKYIHQCKSPWSRVFTSIALFHWCFICHFLELIFGKFEFCWLSGLSKIWKKVLHCIFWGKEFPYLIVWRLSFIWVYFQAIKILNLVCINQACSSRKLNYETLYFCVIFRGHSRIM